MSLEHPLPGCRNNSKPGPDRFFSPIWLRPLILALALCLPHNASGQDVFDDNVSMTTLGDALVSYASGEGLFLDARSGKAYDQGHIHGAVSLPAQDLAEIPDQQLEMFGDFSVLIVYCDDANARTSNTLARKLTGKNLPARVLQGGWQVWVKNGLPVEPADLGSLYGHGRQHCPSCDWTTGSGAP